MQYLLDNFLNITLLIIFLYLLLQNTSNKLAQKTFIILLTLSIGIILYQLIGYSSLINILTTANDYQGLAQWLLLIIALVSLVYARNTFFIQKRPYIDAEITIANAPSNQALIFIANFSNKGNFPGVVKVESTVLKIGDEMYPSIYPTTYVLSPGESKYAVDIGNINQLGMNKIKANQYVSNTIEIVLEVISKEINTRDFKYKTHIRVAIDIHGQVPAIKLIEHELT
jgi:hypothetical protein